MTSPLPLLFPSRLTRGDTIGLIAPASPPEVPERIDETIKRFTEYGFRMKPSKYVRERTDYLAGNDEQRAEDLNTMFADPEVKGIIAIRGGYGSCRLLPLLDYATIRANPKPLLGFSDITALHAAFLVKSGLVTFHCPIAIRAFEPGNAAALERVLMVGGYASAQNGQSTDSPGLVLFSREDATGAKLKTVVPGRASGQLIGGNMTCLLRMLATPYAPDFRGAILFLEDTGEKGYRVDGLFTHLRLAGILPQLAGLILGQFDHPDAAEQVRIADVLQREGERIGVPCVSGAPIGHFTEQIALPHGARAELDAEKGTLTLS